jgi:phospholipid transport system substrate-binding protein
MVCNPSIYTGIEEQKTKMREKKWIKSALLYTVIGVLLLGQTVNADDKDAAGEFLKGNLDAVFTVLQKKDLEKHAKRDQIEEIVTPMFDFKRMAKLSLGRKFWPDLSREDKEKFTNLFLERLRQSYLNKLTAYTDEKIIYESPVAVKKKVHVPTNLVSKDNKISMLYKLYPSNNTWKIYDVEIQGVSIIRSYRSQFKEILQNGTFDDLLQKMQKSVNN